MFYFISIFHFINTFHFVDVEYIRVEENNIFNVIYLLVKSVTCTFEFIKTFPLQITFHVSYFNSITKTH
jgi:hypothetical protein